jgi:plastocyanin
MHAFDQCTLPRRRLLKPVLQATIFFLFACQSVAFAAPRTHVVVIEGMKFSPEVLEVHVGDTIVWNNKDFFPHTVTAEDHGFDSKEIASGSSWKLKITKAGDMPYFCTLHPVMKGRFVAK